ncbi:MAG: TauD/TfdA family dioxygenase [Cyanobacteriota bacterium]|nr:TauD/TfdA family dioxygenase [Cyanobacteriota bacterium]
MSLTLQLEAPSIVHSAGQLTIRPLQPTIGAEIRGVDLRLPVSDEVRDEIKATLLRYKVVFFRDQDITREDQAAFAQRFGAIYAHPTTKRPDPTQLPAIHHIAAADFQKPEDALILSQDGIRDGYHTDTSWRLVPTWGAVLRPIHLPPVGGDTVWVDAGLAYEGLPEAIQARLEGLHVTHDFRASLLKDGHDYPIVAHPIVRTHRETGKKILWVNFTQKPYIIGLDQEDNIKLLTIILDQYRRHENQVRFSWDLGSVAFWDNRATVHYAVRNYGDFPRLLERILIADEPLYADL